MDAGCMDSSASFSSSTAPSKFHWRSLAGAVSEVVEAFTGSENPEQVRSIQAELRRMADLDAAACTAGADADAASRVRALLDAQHANMSWREGLFQQIREAKLQGTPLPDVDYDDLANAINRQFKYRPPRDAFLPQRYATYDDWFLRRLTDSTRQGCIAAASTADVCAPVQGKVLHEALGGEMTLKVSVIAVNELLNLVDGDRLIQMKLRWGDYHRVHSPVDGTVEHINVYAKDALFPGAEAMTIIQIGCEFGTVKMMCIGEWCVQTFALDVAEHDRLRKMDEVGHFDLGSQVILVLPPGISLLLKGGEKVFPGDPVGRFAEC